MKHLPNLISVTRILLSLCLPALDHTGLFVACYLLCGLSDVLDGAVARRFGLQTKRGEQLDSLGDLVFWAVVLALFFMRTSFAGGGIFTGRRICS